MRSPIGSPVTDGWRFSLKGSPRFYDDVLHIIESDSGAEVYFGEALTYERGAAVALWRVRASSFRLAAGTRTTGGRIRSASNQSASRFISTFRRS